MFKRKKIKIIKDLYLDKPLQESNNQDLDFFDREGYQLNSLEKAYHKINKVSVHTEDRMARRVSDDALNVVLQHWYTQNKPHPNIFIDHDGTRYVIGEDKQTSFDLVKKVLDNRGKKYNDILVDYIIDFYVC